MLTEFTAALDGARTLTRVNALGVELIRAHANGAISDSDAERVSAQIEVARLRVRPRDTVAMRVPNVPHAAFSNFPPRKRRCVSPNRAASRARRRELGLAGCMPHALAARFTEGERAVLAVVSAEVRAKGVCDLPLEAIAARAGVCVTLARNAIRLTAVMGLTIVIERRRSGKPNLPNIVRIISREWRAWIWRRGGGCRNANPTNNNYLKPKKSAQPAKRRSEGIKPPTQGLTEKGYVSEATHNGFPVRENEKQPTRKETSATIPSRKLSAIP